jgi:hypothetical protein
MVSRKLLIATAVAASVVIAACDDQWAASPTEPPSYTRITSDVVLSSPASSTRSGALHVTKECSANNGHRGDICTITSSNLEQIEVGSTILYLSDAAYPLLDSDVVLDPPGPGNNKAFGHCTVNLATGVGVCTFAGGTGKFTHFNASVAVSYLGGPDFAWEGTYSFNGKGN